MEEEAKLGAFGVKDEAVKWKDRSENFKNGTSANGVKMQFDGGNGGNGGAQCHFLEEEIFGT